MKNGRFLLLLHLMHIPSDKYSAGRSLMNLAERELKSVFVMKLVYFLE